MAIHCSHKIPIFLFLFLFINNQPSINNPFLFSINLFYNHTQGESRDLAMATFAGTQQKCMACNKTLYIVDKLTADNRVFHKGCFRCHHCNRTLKVIPVFSFFPFGIWNLGSIQEEIQKKKSHPLILEKQLTDQKHM